MADRIAAFLTTIMMPLILGGLLTAAGAEEVVGSGSVTLEIPEGAMAGPDFDVAKATEAYISLLDEDSRARSDAYMEGGYWLQLWVFLFGLGIAWMLLATRLSSAIRNVSERVGRWRWLHTFVYGVLYIIVSSIIFFPMTFYQFFYREHQYDLATQTFGAWMGDQFKGLFVTVLIGGIALTLIYAVIRKFRQSWWIWGAAVSILLLMFVTLISPIYISPLFNDYKALEEGPLRTSILSMAHANGIPADDVYWFDASRQSTRISANVSGLAGTTRISLNDNLLNKTSQAEIEAVMAHEMGHYVLNHGPKLISYFGLLFALGFAFVAWTFHSAHSRWGQKWNVRDIGDTAGYPLFAALFSVYLFVATPIANTIIRVHEAEADNYGIAVARQPDGFARVAMRLSEYRKISPGYWEKMIFYDHPSGRDRVHRAMVWKSVYQGDEPQ